MTFNEGIIDEFRANGGAVSEGAELDAAWARFLGRSAAFAHYDESSGARRIPVVRLSPR